LTEGLVRRGVDVTLFATADSVTTAHLVGTAPTGYSEDPALDAKAWEALHISAVFEQAGEFDVIHNSFDFLPLTYSRLVETPVVTTIHGFSSEQIVPVFEKYNRGGFYVAISDADRHERLDYVATIHHGIDLREFATWARSGPTVAVTSSAARGRCCTSSTSTSPSASASSRRSMACGTPVIARRRGSMAEIIRHGENGFLVDSPEEAVAAVPASGALDRTAVRASVEGRFDVERMVDDYLALYRRVVELHRDARNGQEAGRRARDRRGSSFGWASTTGRRVRR
jgi:hypothetical protein